MRTACDGLAGAAGQMRHVAMERLGAQLKGFRYSQVSEQLAGEMRSATVRRVRMARPAV